MKKIEEKKSNKIKNRNNQEKKSNKKKYVQEEALKYL